MNEYTQLLDTVPYHTLEVNPPIPQELLSDPSQLQNYAEQGCVDLVYIKLTPSSDEDKRPTIIYIGRFQVESDSALSERVVALITGSKRFNNLAQNIINYFNKKGKECLLIDTSSVSVAKDLVAKKV